MLLVLYKYVLPLLGMSSEGGRGGTRHVLVSAKEGVLQATFTSVEMIGPLWVAGKSSQDEEG